MKQYRCHSNVAYTNWLSHPVVCDWGADDASSKASLPAACRLLTPCVLHDLLSPVPLYLVLAETLTVQDYEQIHWFLQLPPHTITFQIPRVKTSTYKLVGRTTELISTGNIRLDKVAHTCILNPRKAETGGVKSQASLGYTTGSVPVWTTEYRILGQ